MFRTFSLVCTVVIAALILTMLFRGTDGRVDAYRKLVERHASTRATVTATDCKDHGKVLYTFVAGRKSYSGNTYWLDRPCSKVRLGESVSINFDPADPTVNTTMSPEESYDFHKSQFRSALFIAGVALFGLAFTTFRHFLSSRRGTGA